LKLALSRSGASRFLDAQTSHLSLPVKSLTLPAIAGPSHRKQVGKKLEIPARRRRQVVTRIRRHITERHLTKKQTKPGIVFCHGLWADGSCFSKVITPLQADGHEVLTAQYSLNTTADDIATVRRALGRVSSPAILVGHSYGGSVITGAGTDDRVAGLVYIAALATDSDETSQTQQSNFPTTDVFSYIEVADGRIWLRPEGIDCFAGDLSEPEKKLVWATQCTPVADLFNAEAGGTTWKLKPSWYIVARKDRTVQPDLERFFAKRMGATTYEVDTIHVPMLSKPEFVLDVIRTAAKQVAGSERSD
jgi:pimeloyl-ACP methyl ester carboxylesterase